MSWLITGGTGSFGHAFTARLLGDPRVLRIAIYSRDELKQARMAERFPDPRMRFFIGDVRNRDRLRLALKGTTHLVHAAAMKRVEACEANPGEAVATNVTGSLNVAIEAISAGVERAVFLSTDKAPAAHTLYGATKFCAERLWVQSNVYAAGTRTKLSASRYGNVLGSRGSVLETWRSQFEAGDSLTLTRERATRFWMTMGEAVNLVLAAFRDMRGGEILVPKIGSATVLDLARAMIGPDTYLPGHVETGLRPGERMHETLISTDEARHTFDLGTHYVIEPEAPTWDSARLSRSTEPMPEGWCYRSDTNPSRLSVEELRRMIA